MVFTIHPDTIHVSLSAIKKLQTSDEVNEVERSALHTIGQWLASHVAERQESGLFTALQDGQMQPIVEAFQAVYRPSRNEDRERIMRLQSSRHSMESLPSIFTGSLSLENGTSSTGSSSNSLVNPCSDPRVAEMLSKVGTWDRFDVFQLASWCGGRPLEHVGLAVLQHLGLVEGLQLPVDKLRRFLKEVEQHYPANWYHNSTHAADVVQTLSAILTHDELLQCITELEALALVLAAIVHDVNHTGVSNDFLIKTKHQLAVTYNDISVNENYHLATAFRLLLKPENNFMEHFEPDNYVFVRSLMVDIVLATDMKAHHKLLDSFKSDLALLGPDLSSWGALGRTHALCLMMHCADIGNAVKPAPLFIEWAHRVNQEFWSQGDKEAKLGLPVSSLNDRANPDIPRGQQVFLKMFVRPCYEQLTKVAPVTGSMALGQCEKNISRWGEFANLGIMGFENMPMLRSVACKPPKASHGQEPVAGQTTPLDDHCKC